MTAHDPHARPQRLCAYSLSFLRQRRIQRMLGLAGYRLSTGWPTSNDAVCVWGQRPVSARGRWIARQTGVPIVSLEDGFLRSVYPGPGDPPLSLVMDDVGIYYDAARPSHLEHLLSDVTLDQKAHARARDGIAKLRSNRLSKYTPPVPAKDFGTSYILVIDQTQGDASIPGAGADANTFHAMLDAARMENPGSEILIKTHPDVLSGKRSGHIAASDLRDGEQLITEAVNPWDMIEAAAGVYTVSSQMGYEAVLAGKPVRCIGMGFYAGWGLTQDETTCDRRSRRLSIEELFTACHLNYPIYYDPWRDRLCPFETSLDVLAHLHRAEMDPLPKGGEVFLGVRRWKRRNLRQFRPVRSPAPVFAETTDQAVELGAASGRMVWAWASKFAPDEFQPKKPDVQNGYIEDGFLRSVGLGAELTEASSFVFDRSGIYFDPSRSSDLEALITQAANGASDRPRAAALRQQIVETGVTKYNVGSRGLELAEQDKSIILVPGQVEDDASIQRGCGDVRTNLALLQATRQSNPDAWIIFKPHPDVEAGLRTGAVPHQDALLLADQIVENASAVALLARADQVWTMTSLMGFEALLRGKSVTCLGTPFYAGWGLTNDLGARVDRRTARPDLDDLVWAALIAYPSYRDPISGLPCPPELIVERLAAGLSNRRATVLSRLQRMFSDHSWIWR